MTYRDYAKRFVSNYETQSEMVARKNSQAERNRGKPFHRWVRKDYNGQDYNDRRLTYTAFICERCGFYKRMNFVMPDQTLRYIGIPECDEFVVMSIIEEIDMSEPH